MTTRRAPGDAAIPMALHDPNPASPPGTLHILHVEDNPLDTELISAALSAAGLDCRLRRVDSRRSFEEHLASESFDAILSDKSMPSFDGEHALDLRTALCPEVPFIFVSGTIGEEAALECVRRGATDYVLKHRLERLPDVVRRAVSEARNRRERLKAEESLRKQLVALETAIDGLAILDQEGCFDYVNESYATLHGFLSPRDLIGQTWQAVYPAAVAARLSEEMIAAVRQQGSWRGEAQGRRADGSSFPQEISAAAIHPRGIVLAIRDISRRLDAEKHIRAQAALLDKAQDAILLTDLNQSILFWNKGAQRIYGWEKSEAKGKTFPELLFPDPSTAADPWQQVLASGEWQGEFVQRTRSGSELIVQSRWTLVTDDEGKPTSVLFINTNVTEQKNLERQFLRAQRMESIGVLAGGIAHDLNNVLAPILMAVQLLRETIQDADAKRWLDTLESSAEQGASLISQVLAFARGVERGTAQIQIRHILGEVHKILRETLPATIELRLSAARDLWCILGDATQMQQVFMNLCVNARDALPQGGRIEVSAENVVVPETIPLAHPEAKRGRHVVVCVSDSGVGICAEDLERIFEPFFTTKSLGKGTGLGLSTVQAIVKSHGGFINVHSRPGQGARFEVYLPAAADAGETAGSVPRERVSQPGNGQGILVVDDEASIRRIARVVLEKAGYLVWTASDGQEALDLVRRHAEEIHLVLTDLMMPVMDGYEMMRALKRLNPDLPLLALTGLFENERRERYPELKKLKVLQKPFRGSQLLEAVEEALNETRLNTPQ